MPKFWRFVSLAARGMLVITACTWIYVSFKIGFYAPAQPDIAQGVTILFNDHGRICYITRFQDAVRMFAIPVMLVFLVIGLIGSIRKRHNIPAHFPRMISSTYSGWREARGARARQHRELRK